MDPQYSWVHDREAQVHPRSPVHTSLLPDKKNDKLNAAQVRKRGNSERIYLRGDRKNDSLALSLLLLPSSPPLLKPWPRLNRRNGMSVDG